MLPQHPEERAAQAMPRPLPFSLMTMQRLCKVSAIKFTLIAEPQPIFCKVNAASRGVQTFGARRAPLMR